MANQRPISDRKQAAIDRLTERYAADELPMEEYERLVADLERVEDERELAVMEDIIGVSAKNGASSGDHGVGTTGFRLPSAFNVNASPNIAGFIPADRVQTCVSAFAERRLSGSWLRKSFVSGVAAFASQVFDFRGVQLPEETVTLEVLALFGSIEIIVPPDMAVRMEAAPFAGEASIASNVAASGTAGTLVVTGNAVFGSVRVRVE